MIAKLVDEMRKAGTPPTEQDWNRLAAQISNGFKARREEVAILRVSADATDVEFCVSHQTLGDWGHPTDRRALIGRQDRSRKTRGDRE